MGLVQTDEYELEILYESKLRECFIETTGDRGLIMDEIQWDTLIAIFLKHRLISIDDTKTLDKFKPSFPINFQTLLCSIAQIFGDDMIKQLNSHITDSKEQLENCRTYINTLNIRALSSQELFQLATILYNCKEKAKMTEESLNKVVNKVKGLSEDSFAFVWDNI